MVAFRDKSGAAPATVGKPNLIDSPLCAAREGDQADASASLASPETGLWLTSVDVFSSRRCGGQRTGMGGRVRPRLLVRAITWFFAGVRSENPTCCVVPL